ncbi:MAG: conserved membrane protein of unknown function [Promethearchaeota archaeon]|nr:MAG: conserved membrane protein of unknown function [Candidatus Lokiarchaeota archaeon]
MRKLLKKVKIPLILILISIGLMIFGGIANHFNFYSSGPFNIVFFDAIIFAGLMFVGIFIILYIYLHDVVFAFSHKPQSNLKGKIKTLLRNITVFIFALVISLTSLLGVMLSYYYTRPAPEFESPPFVGLNTWTAIPSGDQLEKHHKSNTELLYYNNSFWMVYQNSKWHLEDKNGELVVAWSPNALEGTWQTVARIKVPGYDVRDPLLTVINDTMFIYFLPNQQFDPEPEVTFWCKSKDGIIWTIPKLVTVNVSYGDGTWGSEWEWCFGRTEPITKDNITWYVMASGFKKFLRAQTILLETNDGINWKEVSVVYDAFYFEHYQGSEACLEFLPSGELISTIRVASMSDWTGYIFGTPHAGTIIAKSYDNLTKWSHSPDFQTRLDGARLFTVNNRTFAVGRNHLGPGLIGNHVGRKRTAVYEVKENRLIHLFDLPSNGDTAYTGVSVVNGIVYVSYYTNPIGHDLPWIVGLAFFSASEIRIAAFSAQGLVLYANTQGGLIG